ARHVVTYTSGVTFFVLPDWLGNERVKSTQTANAEQSFANLPFGDGKAFWGPSVGLAGPAQFTGLEHDSESNLEHTMFRQYSRAQGRWLSPDPDPGSMDFTDPQSLNRYTYVSNDPVDFADPVGLKRERICTLLNGTGDEAFFCNNSLYNLLDNP